LERVNTLKGPCHEIFDLWFFSSNNSIWAPDTRIKAFLHMASYSRGYLTMKLIFLWSAVSMIRGEGQGQSAICKYFRRGYTEMFFDKRRKKEKANLNSFYFFTPSPTTAVLAVILFAISLPPPTPSRSHMQKGFNPWVKGPDGVV
jgi:hypothetical protein